MNLYLGIGFILGILTILDGSRRKMGGAAIVWGFLMVIFWPIARGLYHVNKPLFAGETREGGATWQVVRSMILWWTILMGILSIGSLTSAAQSSYASSNSSAGVIGTTIGLGLGASILFAIWLVVVIVLFVISLAVKSNIVVRGPTGPLAAYGQGIGTPAVNVNVNYQASSPVNTLATSTPQTNQQLSRVWSAYQSGNLETAKSMLQSIYREHPNEPDVLYMVSFMAEGTRKQIDALERALAINPAHDRAQKRLSELRRGNSFEADLM